MSDKKLLEIKIMKTISVLASLIIFLLFLQLNPFAQVPRLANVLSVQSANEDGIVIQISTKKHGYKLGEDVLIDYEVTNKGAKTIYLVIDSNIELWAKDYTLWLESPIKFFGEFEPYDYEFHKISPEKTFKGTIKLNSKKIPFDKDYDKEDWKVQVGFAYLFDLEDIWQEKAEMGASQELYKVSDRANIVNIGSLLIELDN